MMSKTEKFPIFNGGYSITNRQMSSDVVYPNRPHTFAVNVGPTYEASVLEDNPIIVPISATSPNICAATKKNCWEDNLHDMIYDHYLAEQQRLQEAKQKQIFLQDLKETVNGLGETLGLLHISKDDVDAQGLVKNFNGVRASVIPDAKYVGITISSLLKMIENNDIARLKQNISSIISIRTPFNTSEDNANIYGVYDGGNTALHLSVICNRPLVCRFLAPFLHSIKNIENKTALQLAAIDDTRAECTRELIRFEHNCDGLYSSALLDAILTNSLRNICEIAPYEMHINTIISEDIAREIKTMDKRLRFSQALLESTSSVSNKNANNDRDDNVNYSDSGSSNINKINCSTSLKYNGFHVRNVMDYINKNRKASYHSKIKSFTPYEIAKIFKRNTAAALLTVLKQETRCPSCGKTVMRCELSTVHSCRVSAFNWSYVLRSSINDGDNYDGGYFSYDHNVLEKEILENSKRSITPTTRGGSSARGDIKSVSMDLNKVNIIASSSDFGGNNEKTKCNDGTIDAAGNKECVGNCYREKGKLERTITSNINNNSGNNNDNNNNNNNPSPLHPSSTPASDSVSATISSSSRLSNCGKGPSTDNLDKTNSNRKTTKITIGNAFVKILAENGITDYSFNEKDRASSSNIHAYSINNSNSGNIQESDNNSNGNSASNKIMVPQSTIDFKAASNENTNYDIKEYLDSILTTNTVTTSEIDSRSATPLKKELPKMLTKVVSVYHIGRSSSLNCNESVSASAPIETINKNVEDVTKAMKNRSLKDILTDSKLDFGKVKFSVKRSLSRKVGDLKESGIKADVNNK